MNKKLADQKREINYSSYTRWLYFCFFLFILRVAVQLIQRYFPLNFLPPFDAWYSGVMAYPWLLATQILIIAVMGWLIIGFAKSDTRPKRKLGIGLLLVGGIYFLIMLFRLVAGFTFAVESPWLGAHIPAFFHLVLASFVLLLGKFHYVYGKREVMDEQ